MRNEKVSVIMPAYNCENYIKIAIDSILKQSHINLEILVIYDKSPDNTLAIINSIINGDERVKLIFGDGQGLAKALNKGLDSAQGSYVARMDADDVSMPLRLERQIQLMAKESLDICGCHWKVIDSHGETLDLMLMPTKKETIGLRLISTVPFAHGSVVIKKSFLDSKKIRYDPSAVAEDYSMWIELYNHKARFGNVDEVLFEYRELGQSLSKKNIIKNMKNNIDLSFYFLNKNENILKKDIEKILNKKVSITKIDQSYLILAILQYFKVAYLIKSIKFVKIKYLIIGIMMWLERLRYKYTIVK